jgi:hypothetical protein
LRRDSKALYDLKQAPRAWFAKFYRTVTQLNFSSNALFTRKTDNGIVVMLLYVDDMIITGDEFIGIEEIKQFLCEHFEKKGLGSLGYLLGFKYYLQVMTCFSHRLSMLLILSLERVNLLLTRWYFT